MSKETKILDKLEKNPKIYDVIIKKMEEVATAKLEEYKKSLESQKTEINLPNNIEVKDDGIDEIIEEINIAFGEEGK